MTHRPVYTLLSEDSALNGLGLTADTIKGSTVLQSPEDRPFAVAKWAGHAQPLVKHIAAEQFQFWIYDEPGSYDRINKALDRVYSILCEENVDIVVDGERFSTATWLGDSIELYDDIYKCITRYGTYTIV